MVLVSSVDKVSNYESLAVLIVHVRVQPGAKCAIIAYFMRVRTMLKLGLRRNVVGCNKPLAPRSPGSDLNPVIRTNFMCSVKCAASYELINPLI